MQRHSALTKKTLSARLEPLNADSLPALGRDVATCLSGIDRDLREAEPTQNDIRGVGSFEKPLRAVDLRE